MPTKTVEEPQTHSRAHHDAAHDHKSSVPKQLATPIDLSREGVEQITKALNTLAADSFALYAKTKNFHWHLAGPHFRDYHLLFDSHADEILESIDGLAERVRRIGGTTLRSISHVSRLQTIKDDDDEFVPAEEMVHRLLEDNRRMAEAQRKAVDLCDKHGDHASSNLLEGLLDQTEKRAWFLFEVTQSSR